ncbi:Sulfotransferase [Gracilaria domingensis]|nr:Sulfotransferase [Gracilaria domingensis]
MEDRSSAKKVMATDSGSKCMSSFPLRAAFFLAIAHIFCTASAAYPANRRASITTKHADVPSSPSAVSHRTIDPSRDPCVGRPTPVPVPTNLSRPPSLFFLHIPKTAGTLVYNIAIQYANKTKGLACQFLFDGNRYSYDQYQPSFTPVPESATKSLEGQALQAWKDKDMVLKTDLYKQGACRSIRGHVTYSLRDVIKKPVASMTVMRHPLERLVSMFEFALMMIETQPNKSGWDSWLSGVTLEHELANASSILNRGFYDQNGEWIAKDNIGFSFHFYGVLHQLSGMQPVFRDVGKPKSFRISNAKEMAEKAKDNLCSTHILGVQNNMNATLDVIFDYLHPYARWSSEEKETAKHTIVNRNNHKRGSHITDYVPRSALRELERRLGHEIEVYHFAEAIFAHRQWLRDSKQMKS